MRDLAAPTASAPSPTPRFKTLERRTGAPGGGGRNGGRDAMTRHIDGMTPSVRHSRLALSTGGTPLPSTVRARKRSAWLRSARGPLSAVDRMVGTTPGELITPSTSGGGIGSVANPAIVVMRAAVGPALAPTAALSALRINSASLPLDLNAVNRWHDGKDDAPLKRAQNSLSVRHLRESLFAHSDASNGAMR